MIFCRHRSFLSKAFSINIDLFNFRLSPSILLIILYNIIHKSSWPNKNSWRSFFWIFIYLSICLSIYLSICLSVCPSVCLSVYLSIYLSIYKLLKYFVNTSGIHVAILIKSKSVLAQNGMWFFMSTVFKITTRMHNSFY